jgi:enoyl-CoA hydratase
MQQDHIRFSIHDRAGLVLLDRPRALNALSADMAAALRRQLDIWAADSAIGHVVMAGSEPRAFCAGGDVRDLHAIAGAGDYDRLTDHFQAEYGAHLAVYEFPKPVVCLADGITMGGGAGLMQCSTNAVVSDTTRFAMPEAAIGLFPDAGASVFLGRCPRPVALCLGLTGHIIGAADCLMLGLAGAMVPSDSMVTLRQALLGCDSADIDHVIASFRVDPGVPPLHAQRATIDHVFDGQDLSAMRDRAGDLARLRDDRFAATLHTALSTRCPMSMHVFVRLLELGPDIADIPAALALDYHLAIRMTQRPDFQDGVRAVLIDKTNDAVWHPSRLEDVTASLVEGVFDPTGLPAFR